MNDEPFNPDWASPPGDSFQELINVNDFAKQIGKDTEFVHRLLIGKELLTPDIAEELARIAGSKEFWLRREAQYRKALKNSQTPPLHPKK